jgi:hypothetical protein
MAKAYLRFTLRADLLDVERLVTRFDARPRVVALRPLLDLVLRFFVMPIFLPKLLILRSILFTIAMFHLEIRLFFPHACADCCSNCSSYACCHERCLFGISLHIAAHPALCSIPIFFGAIELLLGLLREHALLISGCPGSLAYC